MSQSLLQTYIDVMNRYIEALNNAEYESASFLKDDVDYYWMKLTPDEQMSIIYMNTQTCKRAV